MLFSFFGVEQMALVLGITGGIATGKSTVVQMFVELGAEILDADLVAREVTEPGSEALADIIREFGEDVVGPAGNLDRRKLGEMVFGNEEALKRLNEITHPRIIKILEQRIARFREEHRDECFVLVVEIPLLVECNLFYLTDKVVVVSSEQAAQIRRLTRRSSLSSSEAARRVAAQMPVAEKEKYGDWVIRTDGTIEDTRRQVESIWREVTADFR